LPWKLEAGGKSDRETKRSKDAAELVSAVASVSLSSGDEDAVVEPSSVVTDGKGKRFSREKQGVRLDVCDCEEATGSPVGLSCDREGFFVVSFERQGQWVAGGDAVPLSKAMCCRPCMPSDGWVPTGVDGAALGVVSVGCHASSDKVPVRCEEHSNAFVSGFTNAVRVFSPGPYTYYPVDSVECCLPALLLDTGDVLEIEACDCEKGQDPKYPVNCGGKDGGTLLKGFDEFKHSPTGHLVPVNKASCCGMCIAEDSKAYNMHDCKELGMCHGHGACILGRCECFKGHTGPDCSVASGSGPGDIPGWAIALIVIGSCVVGIVVLGLLAYLAEAIADWREEQQQRNAEQDGEGIRQPLLIEIDRDDEGSVGSVDTDDSDASEVEERINEAEREFNVDAEQDDVTAAAGEHPSNGTTASQPVAVAESNQDSHQPRQEAAQSSSIEDSANGTRLQVPSEAAASAETAILKPAARQEEESTLPDKDDIKKKLKMGEGPLGGVLCTVCMDRPVQTAIVPCGHVCMCRRCSRRLKRCPVCRSVIARRQRLYV
jgi:syndecan 1